MIDGQKPFRTRPENLAFYTAMVGVLAWASVGQANSSYRYDSLGRLRKSCVTVPAQAYRTDYSLDESDNRSSYKSTKTDIMMFADTSIFSPDGRFQFRMQSDGNLVLYQNSPLVSLWGSGTSGSGANKGYLQSDGNLVLYRPDGSPAWSSNTYMYPCSRLEVQNDGNVVLRSLEDVVVWQTNTGGH